MPTPIPPTPHWGHPAERTRAAMSEPTPIVPPTERRRPIISAVSSSRFYTLAAIGLSMFTVVAVVVLVVFQPQNPGAITTVIGITAPLILGLMGAGNIGIYKVLDGHQSQLMAAIAEKERVKGHLEGLRENPNTNIE